ncbi:MAG TPA: PQQ-binding-like beta-propeller repeat protein [Chthonomonadales bacterium]|nr:PQQ-binding-like beta-propeller repeat protein [Chthonomonadales bacterium]
MRRLLAGLTLCSLAVTLAACRNSASIASNGAAAPPTDAPVETAAPAPAPAPETPQAAQAARGAADWPQFRGPNANGISPFRGINKDWQARPPRVLWRVAMSDEGYSGPAVAGGRVFIVDHRGGEDIVRAIDLRTGQDIWQHRYRDATQHNYGFARATPAVDGDRVYTMSRMGKLHCLNAATGAVIWAKDVIAEFGGRLPSWDMAVSPVIDGRKVIVCPGGPNASVVALDKMTGETLWRGGGTAGIGYATPVIATIGGRRQYVVFAARSIMGVDAEDGAVIWSHPWETSWDVNAATPVVIGDSVFVTSGYGVGCALIDVRDGRASLRWRNREIQAHFSSPIYHNGHIYGTGDPGFLVCLNPNNGQVLWRQGGFEKGGILGVDGVILALNGSNGDLIMSALSPAGYREMGRITPLGGQSWTAPVLADGVLLVRNRQALAAIDLR